VGFTRATLKTLPASDVHLCGNEIPFFYASDFVAECDDLAAKLVAGDEWRMNASLGPAIPFVDMKIGAADGSDFDFDENVGAAKSRDFDFANFRAGRGFRLDHRKHGAGHERPLRRAISMTANELF